MIGFFRRIRKKLADENQFLKYSRYAVGEIVLVMVGILLALQVNNWNERRKDAVLEGYYFNRLIEDLEADIMEIDTSVAYGHYYIVTGNKILKFLGDDNLTGIGKLTNNITVNFILNAHRRIDEKIIVNSENLGESFGLLFDERIVDMNDNTYNELIATGNFEVIKNTALRKQLANYYTNFRAVLDIQDNLLFAIDEYNKALNRNKIPIANNLSYQDLKNQLNTDEGEILLTTLKNLIWNHAYALSPFESLFKPHSQELINEIERLK